MAYIKRGEAKTIPVRVKFNDMDVFPLGNVDEIAFKLGDSVRKTWPGAVRYDRDVYVAALTGTADNNSISFSRYKNGNFTAEVTGTYFWFAVGMEGA